MLGSRRFLPRSSDRHGALSLLWRAHIGSGNFARTQDNCQPTWTGCLETSCGEIFKMVSIGRLWNSTSGWSWGPSWTREEEKPRWRTSNCRRMLHHAKQPGGRFWWRKTGGSQWRRCSCSCSGWGTVSYGWRSAHTSAVPAGPIQLNNPRQRYTGDTRFCGDRWQLLPMRSLPGILYRRWIPQETQVSCAVKSLDVDTHSFLNLNFILQAFDASYGHQVSRRVCL